LADQDWFGLMIFKILRIKTGSDSILSGQDWTEKFRSPLISGCHLPDMLQLYSFMGFQIMFDKIHQELPKKA